MTTDVSDTDNGNGNGIKDAAVASPDEPQPVAVAEDDPAWDEMLQRPATRGELLHMTQLFQLALLSQSMFGISHIEKDERLQRELGEKSLDHAIHIGKAMRKMLDRWKIEA